MPVAPPIAAKSKPAELAKAETNQSPELQTSPGPGGEFLFLQRAIGNHAMGQLLQRSVNRGQADSPRSPSSAEGVCPVCGRKGKGYCPDCGQPFVPKGLLQRKPAGGPGRGSGEVPPIVTEVLRSPGQPLDEDVRASVEPHFGHDFRGVRVHTDARAAESAQTVNALAYTVGNHVVFGRGRFSPRSGEGRRLLAHELAHTVQQQGAPASFAGKLEIGEERNLYEHQADAIAERVTQGQTANAGPGSAAGLGQLRGSYLQRQTPPQITAADDFSAIIARLDQIIRSGGPIPAETRTIGAAIIDVPGFNGPTEMRAISGAATDVLGPGAQVYHASSPTAASRTLSATRTIAGAGLRREFPFSHINDAEMKLFEDIASRLPANARGNIHFLTMRVRQVGGQTVIEPMPACSGCTRATTEMANFHGVNMVSHAATHPPMGTIDFTEEPGEGAGTEGGARRGAGATTEETPVGTQPRGTTPVRVGTEINVLRATPQPDGSTISEIEYNFGENLENLNHGAPSGGRIPSRIVIRVTQNAEGAITAVESMSGESQALAEALARQTLPQGASGLGAAEQGAGEGAGEGAAVAGRGMARLATGLKIGGWAAFVVITGYQLYRATPQQRPRVATQAAGGLAGGVGTTFLVCNVLLDLETLGWGVLICGLIAGGAGTYAGSELAGAAYDRATRTELDEALQQLDQEPTNVRVLFNLLVGNTGGGAPPVDARFVRRFIQIVPRDLREYEVILLAGQLASASSAAMHQAQTHPPTSTQAQIDPTQSRSANPGQVSTVCPNCHRSNAENRKRTFSIRDFNSLLAAPARRNLMDSLLDSLRSAVSRLPERQRAPGDISHHTSGRALPVHPPQATSQGSPTVQQQIGTVCPNCHRSNDEARRLQQLRPTDAEQRALMNWALSQPQSAAPASQAHTTPPGVHQPGSSAAFPSVTRPQRDPCPNCHRPSQQTTPLWRTITGEESSDRPWYMDPRRWTQ